MTKEEFVALVADKGGMAKAEAGRAVEAYCGAVAAVMEKGEAVRLPGFCGFEVQERGERGCPGRCWGVGSGVARPEPVGSGC